MPDTYGACRLYLVTDSTPVILGDRDLCEVVDLALEGGVTCVQYRDKTGDTDHLVRTATRLHAVTQRHGVPLLINDRVDVALAVGCEGVHIGQHDMAISDARKLLGNDAIIGVSVSNEEEALEACEEGADYLGIGTVYPTPTKPNTKHIIGPPGVRHILSTLENAGHSVPAVCIGGISEANALGVMLRARTWEVGSSRLAGIAVVSAIVGSPDPRNAARRLRDVVEKTQADGSAIFHNEWPMGVARADDFKERAARIIRAVDERTPLSHNMTNLVVQNFAANVALAIGASPIMAGYGEEAADLSRLGGALVVNMGSITPEGIANCVQAVRAYNRAQRPIVFDPVGAGATSVRRAAVATIMEAGYIDVIKGNEGELRALFGDDSDDGGSVDQQRGVDSTSTLSETQKIRLVQCLAARERNVVVMTGEADYVSDGLRTFCVRNGNDMLGRVTGTGCCLGTVISAMVAVARRDRMPAVMAGILLFEIAAELAVARSEVTGPGTFVPAFLDQLYKLRVDAAKDDGRKLVSSWLKRARIKEVTRHDTEDDTQ